MELGQSNSFVSCTFVNVWNIVYHSFLSYMFFVSVTAHLLYELVCTFATWRRVQLLCTEAADCLVFCILPHGSTFLGCVYLVFSSFFFLKEVFGEVFSHGHAGHMS